jgi:hypothetical protein
VEVVPRAHTLAAQVQITGAYEARLDTQPLELGMDEVLRQPAIDTLSQFLDPIGMVVSAQTGLLQTP